MMMSSQFVCNFDNAFQNLEDPRKDRQSNHELLEVVFLTLCAFICDCNCWVDVERFGQGKLPWLRKYIRLRNGVPSHDTIGRIFAMLDPIEFNACLQTWAVALATELNGETVAMDGKTLRGSFDTASGKSALHSVSFWASNLRLCLGVVNVDDKSNEIPAAQRLIELVDIKGAVVTADAMHCQIETCKKIIEKEADFVLIAKENQPSLCEAIRTTIDLEASKAGRNKIRNQRTDEINRNRTEVRDTIVMPVPRNHPVFSNWPGLKSIGMIYRERTLDGVTSEESELFISSLPARVGDLSKRLRDHWGIENGQHYILDVTFAEDASRIRTDNAPQNSAAMRRLALNILQQDTTLKDTIRGKRKRCSFGDLAFDRLLANM